MRLKVLSLCVLVSLGCGPEMLDEAQDVTTSGLEVGQLRNIKFQPPGAPSATDYVGDVGGAFTTSRGFGWVRRGAPTVPLDMRPNTRDRGAPNSRLSSLIHMQGQSLPDPSLVKTAAQWEYVLPNGLYTVRLTVGDAEYYNSQHTIVVEAATFVDGHVTNAEEPFYTIGRRVRVSDGRLSIHALGGTNTKLVNVSIAVGNRPSVQKTLPTDGQRAISPRASITCELNLPYGAVDPDTLSDDSVRLFDSDRNVRVTGTVYTSGGGDIIGFRPTSTLRANTNYSFRVTDAVKDVSGRAFLPWVMAFRTGTADDVTGSINFQRVELPNSEGSPYTSLVIGPDGRLYAGTLTGQIRRFNIYSTGTISAPTVINTIRANNGGDRYLVGMYFDPASTADNLILWTTHSAFWTGEPAPDFSGKISRLSGASLGTIQDYVVGLPRSIKDHVTNSIAMRPSEPRVLYIAQGSNTAMGQADSTWGDRPERPLTAAILRVNLARITSPPLNVRTTNGIYSPWDANAAVTVYASGIRNAYDLMWHSNGQLYSATNGSSSGGNTPATPATLPSACERRLDAATRGNYTGPQVPALMGVSTSQHDFMYRIVAGGYYGNPNPSRCEWVLNGGNPTSATNRAEVPDYPVGTAPDRNWRGADAFDVGNHASANGTIEYRNNAFGGALRGKILVTRYSAGSDIVVLHPNGAGGRINRMQTGFGGLTGFNNPVDLIENRANGNLYVSELNPNSLSGRIVLLRPLD